MDVTMLTSNSRYNPSFGNKFFVIENRDIVQRYIIIITTFIFDRRDVLRLAQKPQEFDSYRLYQVDMSKDNGRSFQ